MISNYSHLDLLLAIAGSSTEGLRSFLQTYPSSLLSVVPRTKKVVAVPTTQYFDGGLEIWPRLVLAFELQCNSGNQNLRQEAVELFFTPEHWFGAADNRHVARFADELYGLVSSYPTYSPVPDRVTTEVPENKAINFYRFLNCYYLDYKACRGHWKSDPCHGKRGPLIYSKHVL